MTNNGDNAYNVTFGRIMFLQKIITGHENVAAFDRHDDLAFDVTRVDQRDMIQIICVDEYVLSEAMARQVISDFPGTGIIFVGGKWNSATGDARAYCRSKKVAICNAGDINAKISKTHYWQ
jgi:hypothetical protein